MLLWLVCHESRFEGDPPEKCLLEQWVTESEQRGTRALDKLRDGVEVAITRLGTGFLAHPANAAVRDRLRSGDLDATEYYRQLLRVVYRLLFLFVADDRDLLLVPTSHVTTRERYERFYSSGRIRRLATSRRGGPHGDVWLGLRVVFGALGRDHGELALGLPGLGSFLWSSAGTPDLDDAELANEAVLDAVRALSSITEDRVVRTVDYRNLGSEELGSIYESLLELEPLINMDLPAFALSVAPGSERKTTGSYYTPSGLIAELLDLALEPVLDSAAEAEEPERRLLELTVLDPACGSGHFLIAAAHRIARRLAVIATGDEEPSPQALRAALRDVIGRCVHGIDVNPMAVELCKVILWLEGMEPGKPLSFLEHRIVCGNALLGSTPKLLAGGVPDEAFTALVDDDRTTVRDRKKRNRKERAGQGVLALGAGVSELAKPFADAITAINALPDDTIEALQKKEQRWRHLEASADAERARLAADAWCVAFFAPKRPDTAVITDGVVGQLAEALDQVDPAVVDEVHRLAEQHRFLHPHLAFPDVFKVPLAGESAENPECGWSGGFDVVLGNPPWERVKLQDKEFFASLRPDIVNAANAAVRKRMIAALEAEEPRLFAEYREALRRSDAAASFLRNSGRYPLCGRGDVNLYAVFAEWMRSTLRSTGAMGAVVPTGIATDDTTRLFFKDLIDLGVLRSLFDFRNKGFFPDVAGAQGNRFCLIVIGGGDNTWDRVELLFRAIAISEIQDERRRFLLKRDDFALLNPNSRTCPIFQSSADADLTRSIYRRIPILLRRADGAPSDNPWQASFLSMIHMANDSSLFLDKAALEGLGAEPHGNGFVNGNQVSMPLYEAKMFHQFDHRFGDFSSVRMTGREVRQLPPAPPDRLADPSYVPTPRYWVSQHAVEERLEGRWECQWLLAFRDVCSSLDERTVISTVLPRVAVGHTAPLLLFDTASIAGIVSAMSSFAFDYVARQKLGGTHLTFFVLEQLPLPPPSRFLESAPWNREVSLEAWLASRVVELSYTAWDLRLFAVDVGFECPPFRWDAARRALLRAELDAALMHIFGIERPEIEHVMDTFVIVKRKDVDTYDEYRTKRLILERYDEMAKAIDSGEPYQTVLDPPPADFSLVHPPRQTST